MTAMITQFCILVFGLAAIYLTQQKNENLKKYACIFGLLSQPFFIYSTISSEQWGMFVLSVFYTFAWMIGFNNYWVPLIFAKCRNFTQRRSLM
jgi:hypothetical protein